MNKVIYCPDQLPLKENFWVFLMGPIQGAEFWHKSIEDAPEIPGVTFLSPRREDNPVGSEDLKRVFSDEDYKKQVEWETMGLRCCDLILCWIPNPVENIPGRSYAQTTRFELGENLARGKFVVAGAAPEIPGRRYFEKKLGDYLGVSLLSSLAECLKTVENYVREKKLTKKKIWFSSDTHFGSKRALELSLRPFVSVEAMDEKMIENWNREIAPGDDVYFLGDFGDMKNLSLLNGTKKLVMGNYEIKDMSKYLRKEHYYDALSLCGWSEVFEDYTILNLPEVCDDFQLVMSHFPITVKEVLEKFKTENRFGVFGHIHGRQMIKKFGMDVGVDCNHFCPVSLEKVLFYWNAIKNNYYDDEVFVNTL